MHLPPVTTQTNASADFARNALAPKMGGDLGVSGQPPLNLVDPITSKHLGLQSPFADKLLDLSPLQKLKLGVKGTVVDLPKSVLAGLKGDSSYSFTDFLNVAKIPYYVGGAVLALSFRAGRDKVNFVRQAIGVGLYYLGVMGANKAIDKIYKRTSGIDLGQRYQKADGGKIEKVFASSDFPRLDLLSPEQYAAIQKKLGIPDNVADPKAETNAQIKQVISTSRADKLILGNVLAALGAGYLARSNGWARILGKQGTLKNIWRDPLGGSVANKLANTVTAIGGILGKGFKEKITGLPGEASPMLRKGILGGGAIIAGAVLLHSALTLRNKKAYESSMLTKSLGGNSPYLDPAFNPGTAQERSSESSGSGLFAAFTAARGGQPYTLGQGGAHD